MIKNILAPFLKPIFDFVNRDKESLYYRIDFVVNTYYDIQFVVLMVGANLAIYRVMHIGILPKPILWFISLIEKTCINLGKDCSILMAPIYIFLCTVFFIHYIDENDIKEYNAKN